MPYSGWCAHEVFFGGLDLAIVTDPPESKRLTTVKVGEAHPIVVPEDAYPYIADEDAFGFVVKSGATRIALDGITVRPLTEDSLVLRTYLASRAEEKSKVVSELVRAFMRKLSTFTKALRFRSLSPNRISRSSRISLNGD